MKDLFTIGEVARLFQLNIRTLRYYDSIGVLKPERVDGETGYRYYSTRQFEQLNAICYMRALDMPLEQIRRFLEHEDVAAVLEMFRQQQKQVEEKKQELARIEARIRTRIRLLEDAVQTVYGNIQLRRLPRRELVILKTSISVTDDLEVPIRSLDQEYRNELRDAIFLGKVGVSVSREDLLARRFGEFSALFLLLEEGDGSTGPRMELPEQDYMTLRFQGTHSQAEGYYRMLLGEMERQGLAAAGDSVEITLVDAGITSRTEEYVTELQIPVIIS